VAPETSLTLTISVHLSNLNIEPYSVLIGLLFVAARIYVNDRLGGWCFVKNEVNHLSRVNLQVGKVDPVPASRLKGIDQQINNSTLNSVQSQGACLSL
jgi:hypothetical protein